ncbi:MAG: EAL domain-containing protein [Eubacteriales bacterium]|nr:EAL domain-containing protein [Eubacteriales bacterium]
MGSNIVANTEVLLLCALFLAVLFFFNIRYWKPDIINPLSGIYICTFLGCFMEIGAYWTDGIPDLTAYNYIFNIIYLSLICITSMCFFEYSNSQFPTPIWESRLQHILFYIPGVAEIIMLILAPYTKLIFYIDEAGYYVRANTFFLQLVPYLYLAIVTAFGIHWFLLSDTVKERNTFLSIAMFAVPPYILGGIQVCVKANQIDTMEFSITLSLLANYAISQNNRITRDVLTGLPNREMLDNLLKDKIRKQNSSEEKLYVLMGDLDGFKLINDIHGHLEGDHALIMTAGVLNSICAKYHCDAARFGGDEFVILIEAQSERVPKLIIQEINEQLKAESISESFHLSMSIGCTEFVKGKSASELLREADKELYTVKLEGKQSGVIETQKERSISSASASGKRTVLIIDDSETDRQLLKEILMEEYYVLEAGDGREGMDMLKAHLKEISLVMLDIVMPVMDGYEFLREVRRDALLSLVPVIVAANAKTSASEEKCIELGAADFVSKPYNTKILLGRIGNTIRLRESAAALSVVEYDDLTGLYTRQAFYHHAEILLRNNPDKHYSLIVSDIDDFKAINEKYGEGMGDAVLKAGSRSLKYAAEMGMLVGRYGGDQFVSMMEYDPKSDDSDGAADFMEKMIDGIESSFPIKGLRLKMGIYDDVDHELPISILCDRAIMAVRSISGLYGKRYTYYNGELQAKYEKEQKIELSMQNAYTEKQFRVYYQPKHDAVTGELVGAEALIRWLHPQYGFMPPNDFISLFEKNGFITYADYYVWTRTCENLKKWMNAGIDIVPVSVNASRKDFDHPNHLEFIKKPVEEAGIDPKLLHIEITESVFSDNLEEITAKIDKCREMGFEVEMDDFGSGYSSLNTLATLPLDIVKLDRVFMLQLHNEKKARVLSAVISLTKTLGIRTVAEGVETEEQLEFLREAGCDWIQGYYYSKPLPESEFEAYLRKYSKK